MMGHRIGRSAAVWSLVLVLVVASGCGSAAPRPPAPPRPSAAALDDVRRIVVVTAGESRFAGVRDGKESTRVVDDVMRWLPYRELLGPIARAVYAGVSRLVDADHASSTIPRDVTPAAVAADAFARALQVSGPFDQVLTVEREPVGDERRRADAILRLTVPAWGIVRVRERNPEQVATFADVRAELVVRETGVVAWAHAEDVTHPERLPLETLTRDRAFARQQLVDVLERAGRRLAAELLYARSGR